ncbi:RNA polymerase sigma-70 factor, ECF subfamily [Roseovarius tolerans]|uniref:RNA polymerase sigma-70 factor, ECF subfamily n=1 Tax=Roseovarius tolerans TaxID=74031 RepID=A0A1H7XYA8_9RHOB|nr:sigma-70 family RNA polymerase sigma factor [Roseovarius tolerans]SEM38098.1 RNA polymerase sigma-70 factor, ECF subfamily [Roseovarius tolerans]
MTTRADIENLIARVAQGDRAAFKALYGATSAKLFGVTLRVLNDRAEAEEVLQEIYVKVWHNADRYTVNGLSPMTWLITIARNSAVDRLRKLRRAETPAELEERIADDGAGPEALAVAASERGRLVACFEELAAKHAEAVRRAYLEGETYADLAARFDVPLNTMRTWLRRSLLSLRECLTR